MSSPVPWPIARAMIEFARRVVPLEHPALVKILDVGLDDAGCAVLVTPAAAGPRWELNRIASLRIDPATACSIGLSLAEALDYLHRDAAPRRHVPQLGRIGASSPSGEWELATGPDAAYRRGRLAMAAAPGGFTGVARYGAPELLSSPGTIPTPASDSFTLGSPALRAPHGRATGSREAPG